MPDDKTCKQCGLYVPTQEYPVCNSCRRPVGLAAVNQDEVKHMLDRLGQHFVEHATLDDINWDMELSNLLKEGA